MRTFSYLCTLIEKRQKRANGLKNALKRKIANK